MVANYVILVTVKADFAPLKKASFAIVRVANDILLTSRTCKTCVDKDSKPDSQCEIRNICPDDASTIEKRKQKLSKLTQPDLKVEWLTP